MNSKNNNEIIHLMMNTGDREFVSPIGHCRFTKKAMVSIFLGGWGRFPQLPGWKVTMITTDGYAVMQVQCGDGTLVVTGYVTWSTRGSNLAWAAIKNAYENQTKVRCKLKKPSGRRWIATLKDDDNRQIEALEKPHFVLSFVKSLALQILEIHERQCVDVAESESDDSSRFNKSKTMERTLFPAATSAVIWKEPQNILFRAKTELFDCCGQPSSKTPFRK